MLVVERNLLRASDEMRSAIARGVMHSREHIFCGSNTTIYKHPSYTPQYGRYRMCVYGHTIFVHYPQQTDRSIMIGHKGFVSRLTARRLTAICSELFGTGLLGAKFCIRGGIMYMVKRGEEFSVHRSIPIEADATIFNRDGSIQERTMSSCICFYSDVPQFGTQDIDEIDEKS